MKKIFFFLLLMVIAFSVYAQSPEPEQEYERKFSFQINPLVYLSDIISVVAMHGDVYIVLTGFEFQWALTKYWNISVEPRFGIELFRNFSF